MFSFVILYFLCIIIFWFAVKLTKLLTLSWNISWMFCFKSGQSSKPQTTIWNTWLTYPYKYINNVNLSISLFEVFLIFSYFFNEVCDCDWNSIILQKYFWCSQFSYLHSERQLAVLHATRAPEKEMITQVLLLSCSSSIKKDSCWSIENSEHTCSNKIKG